VSCQHNHGIGRTRNFFAGVFLSAASRLLTGHQIVVLTPCALALYEQQRAAFARFAEEAAKPKPAAVEAGGQYV
jgi:hypothetical protein